MAFDVYPAPQTTPLTIAAGATSGFIAFTERADPVTTPNMVIRLVMIGDGCAPPPGGTPDPTVLLTAGTGAEVTLPADSSFYTIYNTPGTSSQVADARLVPETRNVYKLEVYLYATGSAWQLRIRNNAAGARDFTWVVASTDAEARQPWMHVTPAVVTPLTALTNQTLTQAIQISNKGTGNLNVSNMVGAVGGGFSIATVPAPIEPNACATIGLSFLSAVPGASAGVLLTVAGNDTTAQVGGGHNRQATLTATTGKVEVGLMLDGSGSMDLAPNGTSGVPLADSRWGLMKVSARECLELLDFFGGGMGRFAVGLFPDIVNPGVPSPSAVDLQAPTDITTAAITAAKNSLDTPIPIWGLGTPIGKGLERALGATAATFGYFESGLNSLTYNRRHLLLMSDGAHNVNPPEPSVFYPGGAPGLSFVDKRVKCLAIGYGDPASPTAYEVDHVLMNAIATQSGGQFHFTGTDNAGLGIRKVFRSALIQGLSLDPTIDPPVTLTASRPDVRREVTIVPYDTKVSFVVDWATAGRPVSVTLVTPLCEVITATSVPVGAVFNGHSRYQIFSFDSAFLRNAANPATPRFGTWKLLVAVPGLTSPEQIDYEVITESRLRLAFTADRSRFYAGDAYRLDATLTLDGLPVRNANVVLTVKRPGMSADKVIANTYVTPAELTAAANKFPGGEISMKGVRIAALKDKGIRFGGFTSAATIPMVDANGTGVYSATITGTETIGAYDFSVVATGQTTDGVTFRREQRLHALVEVRPDPGYTIIDTRFVRQLDRITAFVKVYPRDRFGNPLIVEPARVPGFDISVKNAEALTPIEHTADGSYTRTVQYKVGAKPTVRIATGEVELAQRLQPAPVATLQYVDEVLEYKKGGEGKRGANKHISTRDVLGDVTTKKPDRFLALGDRGSVVVGIKNKVVRHTGKEDVTVFTNTDEGLRAYRVEALAAGRGEKWVLLGESAGGTSTFSLSKGRLQSARAIRITDQGGRARNTDLSISNAPGLRLLGVGVASATR